MEYVTEINLNEAIVHVLDSSGSTPVLNDYLLTFDDELYQYVLKHTQKALKDEDLKYAKFNEDAVFIKNLSMQYFNGNLNIVDLSKSFTEHLFTIIKRDCTISSSDLLIVSISTEYGPMIGLFKLDYIKNYSHNIDFIDEKVGINILPQMKGLPSGSQKLQKCAFIKAIRDDNNFDLMVIDKHEKKSSDEYNSNYFLQDFLQCYLINNERDETKKLLKATEKWTRSNLKDNAAETEKIISTLKKSLKENDEIEINALSSSLFKNNNPSLENFKDFITENGVNENITVDKTYIEKKLSKRTIKLNNKINISLDEDTFNDYSQFEIIKNDDDSINILIKNITHYIEK